MVARGSENTTYAVADFFVRRGAEPDAVANEVALLLALCRATPVPVPAPLVHLPELGVFTYRRLPGTPLIHATEPDPSSVQADLVEVLSALRELDEAQRLPVDRYPEREWHRDAVRVFERVRSSLDAGRAELVAAFLGEPPPPPRTVVVPQHNDLGAEHILVGPDGVLTGVIDWTDAARTDPSRDTGSLYRDLGSDTAFAVSEALGRPVTGAEARRIRFHARCRWLEDVAFGLGDPMARGVYLRNARRTFDHTFRD